MQSCALENISCRIQKSMENEKLISNLLIKEKEKSVLPVGRMYVSFTSVPSWLYNMQFKGNEKIAWPLLGLFIVMCCRAI